MPKCHESDSDFENTINLIKTFFNAFLSELGLMGVQVAVLFVNNHLMGQKLDLRTILRHELIKSICKA